MANPTSIVLKSLSILLGVFFVFMGIMKISPMVSKELHRDLVRWLYRAAILISAQLVTNVHENHATTQS